MISRFDKEKIFWHNFSSVVPEGLVGTVVSSLEELREKFSGLEISEINFIYHGYSTYGGRKACKKKEPSFAENPVAYYCSNCDKIVIDAPKIVDKKLFGLLSGRQGYDVLCKRCSGILYSDTVKRS